MTNASKMRDLMLNDDVWNMTCKDIVSLFAIFYVTFCNRKVDQPSAPKLFVPYLRLRLLIVIRIEEEDFVILLSRSTPYILFENKRPIASASDWLWWPAKFLYRGQKCAFKANIYLCLSQSNVLAEIVIIWHDLV